MVALPQRPRDLLVVAREHGREDDDHRDQSYSSVSDRAGHQPRRTVPTPPSTLPKDPSRPPPVVIPRPVIQLDDRIARLEDLVLAPRIARVFRQLRRRLRRLRSRCHLSSLRTSSAGVSRPEGRTGTRTIRQFDDARRRSPAGASSGYARASEALKRALRGRESSQASRDANVLSGGDRRSGAGAPTRSVQSSSSPGLRMPSGADEWGRSERAGPAVASVANLHGVESADLHTDSRPRWQWNGSEPAEDNGRETIGPTNVR